MAVVSNTLKTKLKLDYEEGSKIYSNCREDASDENIYQAGIIITSLQSTPAEKLIKITEAELTNI
ncbi:DUF1659 domain-containing protein [Defluviitalea phaphyphila]|uniref:DUF1659 domain-containing protein n=1 Tax=Defluviitalea phaphyphila TaxID=1473580 RepID=UPI000730AD1F|nr:hypothetical protein [Defluviitalea phaphyphila]